jgi:hypothetical protein
VPCPRGRTNPTARQGERGGTGEGKGQGGGKELVRANIVVFPQMHWRRAYVRLDVLMFVQTRLCLRGRIGVFAWTHLCPCGCERVCADA